MKLSYLIALLASILGASPIFADQDVSHHKFIGVYKDKKNGLEWSKALHGLYTNGCIGADGEYDLSACTNDEVAPGDIRVRVQDSAAAKACEHVGGRLPTWGEFFSLIRNFNSTETDQGKGPRLTSKGRAEMQAVFGDMSKFFWSSSLLPDSYDSTGVFSGGGGAVHEDFRNSSYSVRCVSP